MTDRSVTPAGALAAAEMTRPQSEGGTATQRMAAARTDDEMSPFESNEGPGETQHAAAAAARRLGVDAVDVEAEAMQAAHQFPER